MSEPQAVFAYAGRPTIAQYPYDAYVDANSHVGLIARTRC